jgi:two-component system sensor histidine kinase VicK
MLSDALQSIDLVLDDSVGSLNPMQRNLLETMKASTTRLNGVIEDFIQVTTFKANSPAPTRAPVDLRSIIKDAVDETSSQIRAKRITLDVDLPENLGPIDVDREALGQILIRLLSNAGAASPPQGTMNLRVEIKALDEKQYLLIQVSDTGGGIPREDLQRVFLPYTAEDVPARGVGDTEWTLH